MKTQAIPMHRNAFVLGFKSASILNLARKEINIFRARQQRKKWNGRNNLGSRNTSQQVVVP